MKPAAERLTPQPWMSAPETVAVIAALTARGGTARFVGGCVRDSVLGRPVKDVDIASSDVPEAVQDLLTAAGLEVAPTGLAHGTVTAISGGLPFEITTLRRDVATDGRRATVAFTDDWAADAARRDFTLNALYLDPDGTLYDPTGGLPDLRAGRVRFVGDPASRIQEDYLRILRFFRIYAHYGKPPPDVAALAACQQHAAGLAQLSAERVAHELLRILGAADPAAVLELMARTGVLARIVPEAANLDRLGALARCDGADPSPLRRLAAVAHGGPDDMAALANRLKLSNKDRDRLVALAVPALITTTADPITRRALLYRSGRESFADSVYLRWAADELDNAAGWQALLTEAAHWRKPMMPVGGEDALAAGVPRGPEVGHALQAVEDLWIASDFRAGRGELLAELWQIGRAFGGRSASGD